MAKRMATDLITVREAARQCHRGAETVRRWIWEGKLPAQKLGNRLLIKRSDLARVATPQEPYRAEEQLALLEKIEALRERITHRSGRRADVLEAVDRSRESHP